MTISSDPKGNPIEHPAPGVVADLESLYTIPVPELTFTPPSQVTAPARPLLTRLPRRPLVAAAVILAVAATAAVLLPRSLGGSSGQVSARQILDRAHEAAAFQSSPAGMTYHLVARTEIFHIDGSPGKAPVTEVETWWEGPSRFRTTSRTLDIPTDWVVPSGSALIRNGGDTWLMLSISNQPQPRVAHAGPGAAGGGNFGLPSPAATLADAVAGYRDPCVTVSDPTRDSVAGREAYVITVSPTPSCPGIPERKLQGKGPLTVQMIWVDSMSFIPLRTEIRNADGTVAYRYEVKKLETGIDIPDSTFRYDAPAGVTVIEAGPEGLKAAVAGSLDTTKPAPGDTSNKPLVPGTSPAKPAVSPPPANKP